VRVVRAPWASGLSEPYPAPLYGTPCGNPTAFTPGLIVRWTGGARTL
jgi:hypothetical protein